jgi:hypothetical protein
LRSVLSHEAVTFAALQTRLIGFVNNRISNGDFSERGLARILQVSQPQIHNVLKGVRKLTPELADRIIQCFGMTILDLLGSSEMNAHLAGRHAAQAPVGSHIDVLRFWPDPEIPRKGPGRQSSSDKIDRTETA